MLYAGGVPVPVYPPFRRAQVEDHLRRQAAILRNAGASLLIIGSEIHNVGQLMLGLAEDLRHVETVKELSRAGAIEQPLPAGPDTIALIQYTSGSTGDPKGVVLTHANLLANIRAMGEALAASSSDVFVSWLPLYHDMGLIGAWLGALHYGVPTVIMPPLAFLADPGRWLRAIGRHRATLSAAPNFAYELCCKNVHDEDIKGLDLSSLRMLMNGAEPVSPATIARFTARFAKFGFPPKAMAPVYGLAENSVGLTCPPVGRGPIVDRVERSALSREERRGRHSQAMRPHSSLWLAADRLPDTRFGSSTRPAASFPNERGPAPVQGPIRDAGLLSKRGEDQGAVRRRMAGERRQRVHRRRRCVHHWPHQGHHYQGRA